MIWVPYHPNQNKMIKDRLRLLSRNEPLVLDPTDGVETLGEAADVFKYIDSSFHGWRCGVAGTPRDDAGSLSWSDHVQLGNRVLRPALVYRADPLVFRVRFAVSNPDLAH